MKIKKYDSLIYKDALVKAYKYGNTIEMTTSKGPIKQTTRKIDRDRYVDLETGEIMYYDNKSKTREQNIVSLKKTMKKLRRLIAHNFQGGNNQLWITLTFSEEVTDFKEASKLYKEFIQRLRRLYSNLEYISVIEPQQDGRWHFHVLLKDTHNEILYIDNKTLEKIWSNGFTKTKRLRTTDKIGNYLISYLSNLKLDDDTDTTIKGARLHYYPRGIRIYRRSNGIEDPVELTDTKIRILDEYGIAKKKPDYSRKTTYLKRDGKKQTYYTEFYDDIKKEAMPTKANDFSQKNN